MKVLGFEREIGFVKLRVESELDLWQLQQIIKKDDLVKARTIRQLFVQRENGKEKSKRKLVILAIKVEKVEYEKLKNELRVKGKIVEGPDDVQRGSYHTIEIRPGVVIGITKQWTEEEIERLKRSQVKIEVIKDEKILEDFFMHVNKSDGLVTYGLEQVKTAASFGAVKILLVSDEKIREEEFENVVKSVENKNGEVKSVSKGNLSQKFKTSYQIGAILRYAIG